MAPSQYFELKQDALAHPQVMSYADNENSGPQISRSEPVFATRSTKPLLGLIALLLAVVLTTYYATRHSLGLGQSDGIKSHAVYTSSAASNQFDMAKPRYIFVDLGANRADSLEAFLQHSGSKFNYDFPRPDWATHDEAEIFLFEANPVFNTALVNAKEKYDALGIKVNIFPSTVVDVKDGTRTFYLDTINVGNDFWGSSVNKEHPDVVASHAKGTELSAVNIARWLLMNTLPRDFVVVKMDIEGSEYQILPHMVEMSVWTVVDVLLVEWHDNLIPDDQRPGKEAAEILARKGISMPVYDSAA